MAFSRRSLVALLLGCAPAALAGRSEAKRAAKQARKKAKRNQKRAKRDLADRNNLADQRKSDRAYLNRDNKALDQARRQDLADLTKRRKAHTKRAVFDADGAEEPKPEIQAATRGVEAAKTDK